MTYLNLIFWNNEFKLLAVKGTVHMPNRKINYR